MQRFSYPPPVDPFALWRLWAEAAMTAGEAQAVIGMRLMGMAGFWATTPHETTRMVTEKAAAFTTAAMKGGLAAASGAGPVAVATEMVRPIRRRTRSNVTRLAKRGPSTPKRRP